MPFWNKRRKPDTLVKEVEEEKSAVEVVVHKRATKRTINKTKQVNQDLNRLLEQNGITLQIKIAAGGKH